jgi:hypothetical protein
MAKRRGRPPKPKQPKSIQIRQDTLRPMVREAARAGLVEAIEHTTNFWSVSEGYRKYIDQQIQLQADALLAAVRTAIRSELTRVALPQRRKRR